MFYKRPNNSGKAHIGLLIAVLLITVGAGTSSNLQATAPTTTVSKSINYQSDEDFIAISENGDGTAFVFVGVALADGNFVNAFNFAVPAYSISNNVQPGQSGHGNFSGAGQVTLDGDIIDPNTGDATPAVISVTMTVTGADNAAAFMRQGVFPIQDPVTGEAHVLREHTVGNQAFGLTAGSISISVDGNVAKQATGNYGDVGTFRQHTIERIR